MSRLLRYSTGLLVGLLCALVTAIVINLGWLTALEGSALDAMFRARAQRYPDPRITILVADDATVAAVRQWPLPRETYAKVVRKLTQSQARTIVLDVLFSVPSHSAKADADFARACRESGRVVQAAVFHVPLLYNTALPASLIADKRTPPARFTVNDQGVQCRGATWVSSALPQLQASAPALGHINVYPETDGTLRRTPLIRYRDKVYPSLALAAATHFLGLQPNDVLALPGQVQIPVPREETRRIPVDQHGETWVNWAGGNDTFPTYNFVQLLNGEVPEVALKNRLVLVGITAAGAFEHRATPFSPVQPAVELQASAINDILQNQPLREASLPAQTLLLLLFPVLVGAMVVPGRTLGGMLWMLALAVGLWFSAVWGLGAHNFYMPVAAPLLAGVATYLILSALNLRREWEANWRVDAAVTALARGGALMASGRKRSALLAVIRRTAREVLRARHVFLVLEEPASDTGGAPRLASHRRYPSLSAVGEHVLQLGSAVLWSNRTPRRQRDSKTADMPIPLASADEQLDALLKNLSSEVREAHGRLRARPRRSYNSLLAAPLPLGLGDKDDPLAGRSHLNGVLVAAGRRDGQPFSERDALLLETLAEQAALALENLEYYEALQGRVELANRNLRTAYQSLTQERAKLAAAIESNESALIITDEKFRAVFVNTATAGVLLEATPALGQSVPEVLEAHGLGDFGALFGRISGEGDQKISAETVRLVDHHLHSGPVRNILLAQLTPLKSSEDGALGAMLVVADVTAQRELEQMKDDFVSYVAHELLSPLSTINGYAYLLRSTEMNFEPKERQEMFEGIEYQCERLNRMVTDLLDVSRLEPQPRIPLSRAPVDLVALGEQVLQNQRAALPDPDQHHLELNAPAAPVVAEVDPDRMEQILINLVSNAVKYSPEGGKVTLDLAADGHNGHKEVVLRVIDRGMGMTPDQVARVFQKYYRSPEAQSMGIKGTGLGLHLTKRLVEAHGGGIEVESERGHGTTITVRLPAEAPDEWEDDAEAE